MNQNKFRKGLTITVILIFIGLIFLPNIQGNFIKKENSYNEKIKLFAPGEFIIKIKKDTNIQSDSIEFLNEKHSIISFKKIFKNSENSILKNIYVLKVSENSDILSIINDYSSCLDVEYAEPNHFFYLDNIPNDFKFTKQWALLNTGQEGGVPGIDIDATEAWDIETGNDNVVVAVIDTGVDYYHPDLADNIWINKDEIPGNGIDDDNNDYIDDV
jgi:subtilisin family serine protease